MSDDALTGLEAERARRGAQVAAIRAGGREPYPYRFARSGTLGALRERHGGLAAGTDTGERVSVAGRVMLTRDQGKLQFLTIRDASGEIQLFVSKATVGDDAFAEIGRLDRGDWVGAHGTVMTTRKGELSVNVASAELLAKAIRPLPDKWHGLVDVETRSRQRYADLVVNEEARRTFEIRHATIASFRRTLTERGYREVETPVLHVEAGGAHARPFVTHHQTLDMRLYLRIALELHLKRLIVGGMERVFEIGRVFRNEGISPRHNPEFTMLECYEAFSDVGDVMTLTEALVRGAARDALGTLAVTIEGTACDLGAPWPRRRMVDLASEAAGRTVHPSQPIEELRATARGLGVDVDAAWGTGRIVEAIFADRVERSLLTPTFVTGHPVEISPLARVDRTDPWLTERFELFVAGREIANGFSELNDPVEQRARFEAEQAAKDAGDHDAGTVDEDYLRALEYGMPPTGGLGVGVDRLVMLLCGAASIKDVILFPTLRPEAGE